VERIPLGAVVVVAVLFGLVVGSFLNVVVWRVPRGESVVRPPSHCPGCDHEVRPRDNVPLVSWLLLHGKCRDCRTPISARYPLVEGLTGALFGVVAWRIGLHWQLPAFLYLVAVGVALSFIDLDTRRLPNALTLPSYVVGAVLLSAAALLEHEPGRLLKAGIGMAALYSVYFILMVVKPGGMGFGDVKLAGLLGMYLGFLGWGPLVVGAFVAFLLGGVGGVGLMLAGRVGRKAKIPFGPYMVAGAVVAVLVGHELAHAYARAIGL
jgi:leader peptidase (prepilin peptidase) / N-methyltransferase